MVAFLKSYQIYNFVFVRPALDPFQPRNFNYDQIQNSCP